MPLHLVTEAEAGRRTIRIAVIAAALGSIAGAAIVIATAATVLSITSPTPVEKQTATAPKSAPPPAPAIEKPAMPAQLERLAQSPVGKDGCADQTWPNIESRCLTRVAPRETTGGPSVPAPPALLEPRPSVAASMMQPPAQPQPSQTFVPPQGSPASQTATVPPAIKSPASKAAPATPPRKSERTRLAPPQQAMAQQDDDGDDDVVITQRRLHTGPAIANDDDLAKDNLATSASSRTERRSSPRDVIIYRRAPPLNFLGAIFGFGG